MNEKFINIDNDIFHHRKWYCSAKTKQSMLLLIL